MLRTVTALTALLIAPATHAADCKAISDPTARLACFDALSKSGGPKLKKAVPDDVEKAKRAITAALKHGSAQFGEVFPGTGGPGNPIICGSINARNIYGGYLFELSG
jgi:cytochrome c551/c552